MSEILQGAPLSYERNKNVIFRDRRRQAARKQALGQPPKKKASRGTLSDYVVAQELCYCTPSSFNTFAATVFGTGT